MVLALVVTGKRFSASGQHRKQTNVILSEVGANPASAARRKKIGKLAGRPKKRVT